MEKNTILSNLYLKRQENDEVLEISSTGYGLEAVSKDEERNEMNKWNEQAAPNNNMASSEIKSAFRRNNGQNTEFSEELADGGERNESFEEQSDQQRQS